MRIPRFIWDLPREHAEAMANEALRSGVSEPYPDVGLGWEAAEFDLSSAKTHLGIKRLGPFCKESIALLVVPSQLLSSPMRAQRRGFTLLEALMAAGILLVVVVSVSSAITAG